MKFWPPFLKNNYPIIMPSDRHLMSRKNVEGNVLDIMNRLRRNGYEAYLVGGCVRDILLGKKPKDFDIVTDGRPNQIKRLFRRCYLIGRRFRLAHVYISHDRFVEVATFRAAIDPEEVMAGRFAANNVYGSIEEDAQRRDFTVNSLYFNGADSSIVDYCGGLGDLNKKVLRSIGDPNARFREDPVRIIRAARFCAQLGFKMARRDFKAALECAPCIKEANAHRMLEELYKILRCGASSETFRYLKRFQILPHWLPDIVHDKYHDALFTRLAVIDRRRQAGEEIPNAILLSGLFFDLLNEAVTSQNERRGFQDAFVLINGTFGELATRLRLPRREWDAVCNITARQSSFVKNVDTRKGKNFINRFIHNAHFPDALLFFEILVEAMGKHEDRLHFWKQRAASTNLPAQQSESVIRDAEHEQQFVKRPRRRKRRRKREMPPE